MSNTNSTALPSSAVCETYSVERTYSPQAESVRRGRRGRIERLCIDHLQMRLILVWQRRVLNVPPNQTSEAKGKRFDDGLACAFLRLQYNQEPLLIFRV